jgi:putative peptidoglycan lipid II flippase
MYALSSRIGILSAALGLAVGSALMVLVQLRTFLRLTSFRPVTFRANRRFLLATLAFVPLAAFSLGRQAQVFVERIVGSMLEPGAITYMNYASKVAQMASLLALTVVAVAFPSLARLAADRVAFGRRVEREFRRLVFLIVPATAFLSIFAEPCVRVLFQRGAFSLTDAARTSEVMQVYSLGLMGQVLVSLGAVVCFSSKQRRWEPALAVLIGLLVTASLDVALAPHLGVVALAVGNAAGITLSAFLLWARVGRRVLGHSVSGLVRPLGLLVPLSLASAAVAWLVSSSLSRNPLTQVVVGGSLTLGLYLVVTAAVGVKESRELMVTGRSALGKIREGVL